MGTMRTECACPVPHDANGDRWCTMPAVGVIEPWHGTGGPVPYCGPCGRSFVESLLEDDSCPGFTMAPMESLSRTWRLWYRLWDRFAWYRRRHPIDALDVAGWRIDDVHR